VILVDISKYKMRFHALYCCPSLHLFLSNTRCCAQGTLRVLLVLLHDFPEFLCEYHFELCNKIPPSCIQMRNLILSAFPRMMRLPDPFTPNLKVGPPPSSMQAPESSTAVAWTPPSMAKQHSSLPELLKQPISSLYSLCSVECSPCAGMLQLCALQVLMLIQ
jgi:hypothetical protein